MRILSGLSGLVLLVLAISFAVSNRQTADIGLWPFATTVTAPLYLLIIATLCSGIAIGALFAWFAWLPQHLAARKLQQEITALHAKLDTLHDLLAPLENSETNASPSKVWNWRKPA